MQNGLHNSLIHEEAERVQLAARRDAPNVLEGHAREDAAPVECQADAAHVGENLVAQVQATRVTLVGVTPHAVR